MKHRNVLWCVLLFFSMVFVESSFGLTFKTEREKQKENYNKAEYFELEPFLGSKEKIWKHSAITPFNNLYHSYEINALPGRVKYINDPDDTNPEYLRLTIQDGDCGKWLDGFDDCIQHNGTGNDRTMLHFQGYKTKQGNFKEGEDYIIAARMRLVREGWEKSLDFEQAVSANLFEFKVVSNQANFSIFYGNRYHEYYKYPEREENVLYLEQRFENVTDDKCKPIIWFAKEAKRTVVKKDPLGEWVEILVKTRFSRKSDGYFKLWIDGMLSYQHAGANMCWAEDYNGKKENKVGGHIAIYKQNDDRIRKVGSLGKFPTVSVDFTNVISTRRLDHIKKFYKLPLSFD